MIGTDSHTPNAAVWSAFDSLALKHSFTHAHTQGMIAVGVGGVDAAEVMAGVAGCVFFV